MAKILIVEDEQAADEQMKDSLQGLGHIVVASVASGSAAIEWATSTHPDVVLMDVRVPQLTDGLLAIEEISSHLNIPIVYWTPYVDCLPRQPSLPPDALGGLAKPCQTHELYAAIEIALLRHQCEQRFVQLEHRLANLSGWAGELNLSTISRSSVIPIDHLTSPFDPQSDQKAERGAEQESGQSIENKLEQEPEQKAEPNSDQRLEHSNSNHWQPDCQSVEALLRQQAERESFINGIAQRIRQSLRLEEILYTTVTEIRQLLQSDRVIVCRVQPSGQSSVIVESVAYGFQPLLGWEIPSHSTLFHTDIDWYASEQVQVIHHLESTSLEGDGHELWREFRALAQVVVPLLQGLQLWGWLIVQQCDRPRNWQRGEVELLKQLATQVAIAIQQAELYEKVQQLNSQLEQQVRERTTQLQQALDFEALLKRITDKVRDSLDESQILQTAVQALAIELKTHSCDTGLYDLTQRTSTITHEFIQSEQVPVAIGKTISMSVHPEVYERLLQGETLQFCWLAVPVDVAVRQLQDALTVLVCPLMEQGEVIGDLWLYKASSDEFDAATIRLVQQVATQCAIAMRQARLYKASQAQVLELEHLNQLKDDFLNTISHELRTPVASIRMASQMLEIRLRQAGLLDASPEHVGKYLQILQDECDREINLINNILDLSRLDAQIEPITPFPIQLQNWIPHLLEPFTDRIEQQQQHLSIDIPDDLPPVQSDLSSLGKVLTELINNACKYTPAHQAIHITTTPTEQQRLQIRVSNSGVELSVEEQSQIFEKFYRIPNADPWRQGGTGLGLALVKRLVAHIGGSIGVTSENNWTTFIVELPVD